MASKQSKVSRLEAMRIKEGDDYFLPNMPPMELGGGYLATLLFEVGPTLHNGVGAGPITHLELQAWQANIGLVLRPWEARVLHQLSCEYLIELSRAEKADRPAPYVDVTSDEYRLKILPNRIKSMFREST